MVQWAEIQQVCEQIVRRFHPQRVILFGSYAYGAPSPDSDVDLLVILPYEGHSARKSVKILNTVDPPFPVDLLVRTPEEVQQRLAWHDNFIKEIIEKGRVLYESHR